ncbi:unnamed protein product [Withania somnifera]
MEAESSPSPPPPSLSPSPCPPLKTYILTPCKTTTPINVLKDISFTAYPSQILAIVGPSGAGKSTLLDILPAGTSPTSGTLLLNSLPLHSPSSFRKLLAYETFAFSARLLNPKLTDVSCIVDSLLSELRLTHLAHTRLAQGLSGGERRRVSIGLSLLHDPAILLLDEPTSSLDSNSALNKNVVHYGTLLSLEGFLLENGFTVPPKLNSLEYAMEILSQLNEKKLITPCFVLPPSPENPTAHISEAKTGDIRYRSSRLHEAAQLLLTNTLQALGVGIVLGTIYINIGFGKAGIAKRFGFFASTLTFLLSSTTETLSIFTIGRPILLRETSIFLPYLLVVAILYSVSLYFLVGLCYSWQVFTYFVLTIWVSVLMANSFVLFLSSVAANYIAGTSLVALLLAGSFLFSGYFISKEIMPKFWTVLHYLSMYKYGLDALLINEYCCLVTNCLIWYHEMNKVCMVSVRDVLDQRGFHERLRWTNIYILIGYRLFWLMVLVRRVSRSKKRVRSITS